MGTGSTTDCSDLKFDLKAKSGSGLTHPDGEPRDGNRRDQGITHASSSLATNYLDDSNKSNNGVVGNTHLRLSAVRPGSTSTSPASVAHQASNLPVNTDTTQESTGYVSIDITKEIEAGECSFSTEECHKDGNDTSSIKKSKLSAASSNKLALDSKMSDRRNDQSNTASESLLKRKFPVRGPPNRLMNFPHVCRKTQCILCIGSELFLYKQRTRPLSVLHT